jgi:hypothetical protein
LASHDKPALSPSIYFSGVEAIAAKFVNLGATVNSKEGRITEVALTNKILSYAQNKNV